MKYLFKTIIRNFIRKPVTNLINLLGLTISLALVIILSTYCYSELTTDSFHENGDKVYLYLPSDDRIYTPGVLKENIDIKVPGVESSIRIAGTWEAPVFQAEGREPVTSDLLFADEDFFKFFTYNAIYGDPESALKAPLTVVITETLAEKLFGQEKAIGEIIKLNNNQELTVSAVIKEPKANSCLSVSAVASMATQKIVQGEGGEFTEWGWCDFQTFILLSNKANPGETEKTILNIIPEDFREDYKSAKLVPLRKVYFSKFMLYGNDYLVSGDKMKVMLLLMVAGLVLVIALINFINISSSQWLDRIKQTGVLKILGAKRSTILINVLFESFIFFLVALIIAIEIVNSVKPLISEYTGIHYSQNLTYSPGFIILSLSGILFLSLILSIIPALRLSSSRPIDNLKNTVSPDKTNFSFRGLLVTMQFVIAIVLIAFTMLVQKQVRFGSTNLGINQENIIGIKLTPQIDQKKDVLKKLLLEKPAVNVVSFTQYYPGKDISQWGADMELNGEKKRLNFDTFSADAVFFEIMGLHLVSGRFYSDDFSTDKEKILVNETFLREHNITNPLGGRFIMGKRNFEIIGVVKDFHYKSVSQPIVSLAIRNESYASYCLVKIRTTSFKSLNNVIQDIKTTASELSSSFPVEVSFFDQAVGNMYQSELRFQRTFSLFAGSAIIICCLGILAMSLFSCQRRVKEIGIRKINGANVTEVMIMLNRDLIKLLVIAFIIAMPVAWYVMHKWLQNYAYQTELSWWIFALAGLLALAIAIVTVSLQSWKAATRNPVEALRYE
ncbi:MAG: ABC transporter permease [Bacteroidia bacterium]|nr:ABC transporter permease [Bacteroidia bacterium]